MTHTITAEELSQLREALEYAEDNTQPENEKSCNCPICRAHSLLDTIAARTSEPVKKADLPERIFLQISKEEAYDTSKFCGEIVWREVTWCEDRINDDDMLFIREDLIPAPQPAAVPDGMAHQYYYKRNDCTAKDATDRDCICWHNEGTGPYDTAMHDDPAPFLEWRIAAAPKEATK